MAIETIANAGQLDAGVTLRCLDEMKAGPYWIDGVPRGRLAIMPRPRAGDWLADELASWQRSGVDVLVSLLAADETDELGLANEGMLARELGMAFVSFPIPDRGVPDSADDFLTLVNVLVAIC